MLGVFHKEDTQMSTATLAAPATPMVQDNEESFTLCQGETHAFTSGKIEQPLTIRVVVAEVGTEFMTINGKAMNGPRLVQTVGPPHDPLAHQSARLREKDKPRKAPMPRSQYRWEYTIPGIVRFTLSEVEVNRKPAVRFKVDKKYVLKK